MDQVRHQNMQTYKLDDNMLILNGEVYGSIEDLNAAHNIIREMAQYRLNCRYLTFSQSFRNTDQSANIERVLVSQLERDLMGVDVYLVLVSIDEFNRICEYDFKRGRVILVGSELRVYVGNDAACAEAIQIIKDVGVRVRRINLSPEFKRVKGYHPLFRYFVNEFA